MAIFKNFTKVCDLERFQSCISYPLMQNLKPLISLFCSCASRNDMLEACDSRNLDALQKEFPLWYYFSQAFGWINFDWRAICLCYIEEVTVKFLLQLGLLGFYFQKFVGSWGRGILIFHQSSNIKIGCWNCWKRNINILSVFSITQH